MQIMKCHENKEVYKKNFAIILATKPCNALIPSSMLGIIKEFAHCINIELGKGELDLLNCFNICGQDCS